MFTWMIGLWANPLARKIIIYGAVLLAILYGLRLWGNKQWYKGESQGRQKMAIEMEKAKQAEWAAKENAIEAEKTALDAKKEQLEKDRITIYRSLNESLKATADANRRAVSTAVAVPDNQLNSAIRRQLAINAN